jgi:O-antigen ligase
LLPGVLALCLWAVLNVQRFLLIAVLGTMIYPATILRPGGTEVAVADVLLLLALGGWLISGAIRAAPGPWLQGNPFMAPSLIFVAVNAASIAWSIQPHATVVFVIQLVEIVVVLPLAFASVLRSADAVRQAMWLFIALTSFMAVAAFVAYLPHIAAGQREGQYLPGLNKNAIGSFVGAGLVLAYVLWLNEKRLRLKHLLALCCFVEVAGLLASVSRGAIIGAFFAMIGSSLILRRHRFVTLSVAAVFAILFLAIVGLSSGVNRSEQGSFDSSSVRSYSFAHAVDKIRDRPLLGSGAATYKDYIVELDVHLPDPNNTFLLTWAEIGIPGLLALLFLLSRFARMFVRARRLPTEAATIAVAAGAVTISLFVHFQFDVTWTRGTTSLAFAMIGVMAAVIRLAEPAHAATRAELEHSPMSRFPARAGVV